MEGFVSVGSTDEFPPGHIKEVEVGGRSLCVVQAGGQFHAFDRFCTHEFIELTYGYVLGGQVHCGQHGAAFNLETGEPEIGPAELDLKIFTIKVENDEVFVGLEQKALP